MPSPDPGHDPRTLRALAHPVRMRILDELEVAGPLRAADLAQLLDIPANQASFHLRQLAKYGLVQAAPEAARDRRDRVWKAVAAEGLAIRVADLEAVPGGRAAVAAWRRAAARSAHRLVDTAYAAERQADTYVGITTQGFRLTKQEATELAEELDAVLRAWRSRGGDAGADGRRAYQLLSILQPHPDSSPY